MLVAKKILYSGNVQGVGFRYAALKASSGLGLNGFVRNLDNGQVEMVVEGEEAKVDILLERIAERMNGLISKVEIGDAKVDGLNAFEIRR